MRKLVLVLIVTAVASWWGAHHLYIGLRNREPLELTCAEYLSQRPDAEWLRLTHCTPDFDNLAYVSTKYRPVRTVYVPVRAEGTAETNTSTIVIERDDDEVLELAGRLKNAGPVTDKTVERLVAAFAPPIEGLVQVGLDLSDKRQKELEGLDLHLASDFVIVKHGDRPRPLGYAIGALALGFCGAAFLAVGLIRRFRKKV
jgi:hypothetical protein